MPTAFAYGSHVFLGLADARQTTTEHTNSPHTQQFLVKHFREILDRNAFVVKCNN